MSDVQRILVPLAEGFEEIEAVVIIDVLRRAGLEVTVAGLNPGPVRGAHGITIVPDCSLGEVPFSPTTTDQGQDPVPAIVLPGGMPGTQHLLDDKRILEWVRAVHGRGGVTAAICAAPRVLASAGVLEGLAATSHPSVRDQLPGATVVDAPRVVSVGAVVTSQGAGTAMEFALHLVGLFCGAERAQELAAAMVC